MKFSLHDLKEKYNEFIYNKLNDFISSEINSRTSKTIRFFIENPHITGEYEGNQYVIIKVKDNDILTIVDEVSEAHGVSMDKTRFNISINELLEIISTFNE